MIDEDIEEEDINRFLSKSKEYAEFVNDYLEDKDQCPWCLALRRNGRFLTYELTHDEECPIGSMILWMIKE